MKIEHRIILELCKDINEINLDISEDEFKKIDWSEVLWQLQTHKIDSYVAKKKINNIPCFELHRIFGKALQYKNQFLNYRNKYLYTKIVPELIDILNPITEFVFLKGIISAHYFYKESGERDFNDIDILIPKKNLKSVKKALADHGYTCGDYGFGDDHVTEAAPTVVKLFEMTTHQTYPFHKIIPGYICESVTLDINFGLGPEPYLLNQEFIKDILANKEYLEKDTLKMPCLSKEYLLLYTCLHIYRDATAIIHIKNNKDIQLYQYVDLYKILKKWYNKLDWDAFLKLIQQHCLEKEVYFSLYHCSMIFEKVSLYVKDFLDTIRPDNLTFLNEYGIENNKQGIWSEPFIERVFSKNRFALIEKNIEEKGLNAFQKREEYLKKQRSEVN